MFKEIKTIDKNWMLELACILWGCENKNHSIVANCHGTSKLNVQISWFSINHKVIDVHIHVTRDT